jgi:pimeloyl-ACP methyl ester carboxylesterase
VIPSRIAALLAALLAIAGCSGTDAADPAQSGSPRTSPPPTTVGATTTTSAPLAAFAPGDLLEATEVDTPTIDGTVWVVRYRSTSVEGAPIEVSGIVARPDGPAPAGGFPVLAWAHGTTGVADACAPSRNPPSAVPDLQGHLDAGFVVAATDYEGLGTPGIHPYLVADSEGRGVLDAARVARQVVPEATEDVAVVGHSQGGHAALAAAEIADDWAPELRVVGTVAVAPAADLSLMVPAMFSLPVPFRFGVLVAAGWADAYDDLEVTDLLAPDGVALVEAAEEVCVAELFGRALGSSIDELVVTPPEAVDRWARRIQENTIDPDQVDGPVLLVQGTDDVVVPAFLADALAVELCAADVALRYAVYEDADHGGVLAASFADVRQWIAARLAGEPVDPACPA